MCGIVGYVRNQASAAPLQPLIAALRQMGHRGPDDEGVTLIDRQQRKALDFSTSQSAPGVALPDLAPDDRAAHDIAFGHRRFSIIDLSIQGHQPLWSIDRKVCVSLNGEIFNHRALRAELIELGWRFMGTSDTEVLALAYRQWGVECFQRFNGFWAVSLYDVERNQVLLARDRLGKAPLYYCHAPDGLYWGSEVNVVRDLAPVDMTVREQSVVDFVSWNRRDYDHTTFFNEIKTLPSATYAWVGEGGRLLEQTYWHMPTKRMTASDISTAEAAGQLRGLLEDATRIRLEVDVPASVQVSGGLDSSAVLALVAQQSKRVAAFTVSFSGTEVDEEPYARAVVDRYKDNVDYHIFEPPDDDLLNNLNSFIALMGEPFHSPNLFTANRIWKLIADQGYRVNLYGSGGDEVLAGYSKDYFYPYVRRLIMAGDLSRAWNEITSLTDRKPGPFKIDYGLRALRSLPYGQQMMREMNRMKHRGRDAFIVPSDLKPRPGASEDIEKRLIEMASDQLLNYWLRIDSQSSMSIPLELRSPLLDYRVVELGFQLPLEYLMRDGWMKWILREAMDKDLPPEVTWRREKAGFPFQLSAWLIRHRERLLDVLMPLDCPYIDNARLAEHWDENARGGGQMANRLWAIVSLGLWWKKVIEGKSLANTAIHDRRLAVA